MLKFSEVKFHSDGGAFLSQIEPDSIGAGVSVDHEPASQLVARIYAHVPVDGEPQAAPGRHVVPVAKEIRRKSRSG